MTSPALPNCALCGKPLQSATLVGSTQLSYMHQSPPIQIPQLNFGILYKLHSLFYTFAYVIWIIGGFIGLVLFITGLTRDRTSDIDGASAMVGIMAGGGFVVGSACLGAAFLLFAQVSAFLARIAAKEMLDGQAQQANNSQVH